MLKKEINTFLCAISYFTRIRIPIEGYYTEQAMGSASKYLPIVGWIVGGLSALTYWLTSFIFPHSVAIVFVMIFSILITGAFHEDGFADVCDGFGGGWTKERILSIMKDSRVGAYGAIGVSMLLLTRFVFISNLSENVILPVFVIAASLSRGVAATFLYTHEYARNEDTSKVITTIRKFTKGELAFVILTSFLPLLLFWNYAAVGVILIVFAVKYLLGRYFEKWIGGFTGDCLGATQQVTELVVYLYFIASIWKSI